MALVNWRKMARIFQGRRNMIPAFRKTSDLHCTRGRVRSAATSNRGSQRFMWPPRARVGNMIMDAEVNDDDLFWNVNHRFNGIQVYVAVYF